ncbi:MAG TPA: ATP phosphoribosyltransferase regulatory subunit [Burkholderiaceae bacterium]|nr:ATP phosphoribosyltransferase regulatory subunit [Burkholderiaceae bacterium]
MPRWLLPESIADILPAEARRIEDLRRVLLDAYRSYGYELVMPPLVEYIESLLTGSGRDLDLRTFKLVDQLSGRTLGLRADMTPQVARIDAHLLNRSGITRLCYAGSVLHARAADLLSNREPLQIGAELYGHEGLEADLEVIDLLLRSLQLAGVERVRLDVAHVAIVRTLVAAIPQLSEDEVFPPLLAKDAPALREALGRRAAGAAADALLALPALYGTAADVLKQARERLPALPPVVAALEQLERLMDSPLLAGRNGLELAVDLGDLRGYRYHNGISFAAYVPRHPTAIGRGGRYDNVGAAFGRARPATGFSLELRTLAEWIPDRPPAPAILAPWSDEQALADAVRQLRDRGEFVVQNLPGHEHESQEFRCDRELVRDGEGRWVVRTRTVS